MFFSKKQTLLKSNQIPSRRYSFTKRIGLFFSGLIFRKSIGRMNKDVDPDEIFIDSSNLPDFDTNQFEGRIEKPISATTIYVTAGIFLLVGIIYLGQSLKLQFFESAKWVGLAENNRLNKSLIFSERGVIQDRNGILLAWNQLDENQKDFPVRKYRQTPGTHNLIGYVKYPKKDKSGFYYNTEYSGADGVESYFDKVLKGGPGLKLTETDVQGNVISESVMRPPQKGTNITLTLDARVQESLYESIKEISRRSGFLDGAGMIMDINTGEVIASVSYPEYDSNIMTAASNTVAIREYLTDKRKPFLDRISQGLYTPGSIVKPIFALAALQEQIISPDKQIESTGELKLPNPYRPGEYTIFKDWKAHGYTDMREAIAVSSDVYFYQIGGGFLNQQKGLGITKIDQYSKMFGLGEAVSSGFFKGKSGVVPTPEWKAKNFNGDIWRVGDTYNTAIGQYGYQITPTQAIRAVAAIANNGTLVDPRIFKTVGLDESKIKSEEDDLNSSSTKTSVTKTGERNRVSSSTITSLGTNQTLLSPQEIEPIEKDRKLPITNSSYFKIVQEGMRMTVTDGTMKALNLPGTKIAGKTGTAQTGLNNEYINSWATGFFPYDKPKYAFIVMMEKGPSTALFGSTAAFAELMGKMALYMPEYFRTDL